METFLHFVQVFLVYGVIGILCLAGVLASCLALSGTWLIVTATAVAAIYRGEGFPSWWVVLIFVVLAGLIELVEFFASAWGVQRRGGSRLAGFAAVAGGIIGMIVGSFIPPPVIGSLVGMVAGSFGFAYLVEYQRLQHRLQASHIASGAVIARIMVVLLKVGASLGMSLILFLGLILN